jgi:hypothetical protein
MDAPWKHRSGCLPFANPEVRPSASNHAESADVEAHHDGLWHRGREVILFGVRADRGGSGSAGSRKLFRVTRKHLEKLTGSLSNVIFGRLILVSFRHRRAHPASFELPLIRCRRVLLQARIELAAWRNDYNHNRPHSGLGWLTPSEFANHQHPGMQWPSGAASLEGSAPMAIAPTAQPGILNRQSELKAG